MKIRPAKPSASLRMFLIMLSSLLLIASAFLAIDARIIGRIENNIHHRVEEYAAQENAYITSVLDSRFSLLESIAALLESNLVSTSEDFEQIVKALLTASDFDHVLFIQKDGTYFIDTEQTGQGTNTAGRMTLLSEERSISPPFRAFFSDNEQCVLFSVPVTSPDGDVAGMLCGTYTAQYFARKLLHDNVRDEAFTLLTDFEGNVLFSSSQNSIFIPDEHSDPMQTVLPSPTFFSEEEAQAVRTSIAQREQNLYQFAHNDIDYVLVQTPLKHNDWIFFCMVPTDAFASDYTAITQLRNIQMLIIISVVCLSALALITTLLRERRRLRRENSLLSERARTDSMTGLFNQASTRSMINTALSERGEDEALLLLLDLDNFKAINDTHGHPIGDRAILILSDLLKKTFSSAQIIGRTGGDEFMIYLGHAASREAIAKLLIDLQAEMLRSMGDAGDLPSSFSLRCSIGAAYAREGDDFISLYRRADTALYYVKRHGKDGYCFFEDIA